MSQFSNSRVVITGGRGFVGQHLTRELETAWPGVVITLWDLPEVDITKPEMYQEQLAALAPDWIVHLAALAAVGPSAQVAERYMAVNAKGTQQLLEAVVAESPQTNVLVVSSAELYGLTEQAQRGEAVLELSLRECRPANPYAESKLEMEKIVAERFVDRTIRVRPFPHFGPGQKMGFVTSDFAAQIAQIEKLGTGTLRVGNLTTQRDFTDVRDVVRAYRLLMEQGKIGDVYNVGSGVAWSIQAIADHLIALSDAAITIEQDLTRLRASEVPILIADTRKLRTLTGWAPIVPFEQSLLDILNWWRELVG